MPKSYTPVHDSIPEEDHFSSDDESNFRLHRIDRSASRSRSSKENDGEPSILAPLVRKSTDFETYLDSLTEDEQQLLSASKDHDIEDLDRFGDGTAAARRRFSESKKRRKLLAKRGGWRAVYYSKTWWRTLVVVIIALGLLVWGFLKYASTRGDTWEDYVRLASSWTCAALMWLRICPDLTRTFPHPREARSSIGRKATRKRQS